VQGTNDNEKLAGLGDVLIIKINHLKDELARQQALPPEAERIDPRKYTLFLDDMEVKKLYPIGLDPEQGSLHFKLTRTDESKDVWGNLLAGQHSAKTPTKASVGLEGKMPLPNGQSFTLRIYNPVLLFFGVALFLVALVLFVQAARTKSILRDSGPPKPPEGKFRPYSLARVQVAWWFFIILASFLFIAFVTLDFDTISNSSLVLLGIGTGTALGAAMVDANRRTSSDSALATLVPRRDRGETSWL